MPGGAKRSTAPLTPWPTWATRGAHLAALALLLESVPAAAQNLAGRVLEEGREVLVAGAVVTLVDGDGDERASAIADSLGRDRLAPPAAGEYVVRAVRLGYEAFVSPRFAMGVEGEVPFDLRLRPLPVGLEGFDVSVDRPAEESADLLPRPLGLDPAELGQRWIDREEIEKAPITWRVGSIALSQGIAGIYLPPNSDACVQLRRVQVSGRGFDACALTVLDGALVPVSVVEGIASEEIEAVGVLTPVEATTLFGTQGGAGAVLVWTRRGGGR